MITGKLASYGAARREIVPGIEHRQHKGLNNGAENLHQPTRRGERQMKQFKSAGDAQRFLSAHDQINNLFHFRRDVTAQSAERLEHRHSGFGRKSAASSKRDNHQCATSRCASL
jgi:putative transposase